MSMLAWIILLCSVVIHTGLESDLIAEIAAVIAFSAIKNNDKVSLILFSDGVEKYFPPRKGNRHVLRIIRELLTIEPQGRVTNISSALSFLGKVQRQSGICFLISDFIAPDFSHEASLTAKRHDLVPIAIVDPAENTFPAMGLTALKDLESGEPYTIDSTDASWRDQYAANSAARLQNLDTLMKKIGVDVCTISDQESYMHQLRKYFLLRKLRSK